MVKARSIYPKNAQSDVTRVSAAAYAQFSPLSLEYSGHLLTPDDVWELIRRVVEVERRNPLEGSEG